MTVAIISTPRIFLLVVVTATPLLTHCGRFCIPWISKCRVDNADEGNSEDALATCQGNPGWSAMRRLNKAEYNNTIRDLLDDRSKPADSFSENADGVNNGFDNNGESLAMGPSQVVDFVAAAEQISREMKTDFSCPQATSSDDPCVNALLAKLALKAYRRPIQDSEVSDLRNFVDLALKNGDSVQVGLQLAVERMLLSPHFLFRVELPKQDGVELTDFELASRLSYFLWNSMPDDELLEVAAKGLLRNKDQLIHQAQRLLDNPKAADFIANFTEQWLETRRLKSASPDPTIFRNFTDGISQSMQRQASSFIETIVRENAPVKDIVSGPFTMLDVPLSTYYGIPLNDPSEGFHKVDVGQSPRRGVIGLGGFHVSTSNPDGTSMVKRGKWVLKNLLCTTPPPPPPNIPPLDAQSHAAGLPQRKRMEMHRADPSCYSCHANMDPIGAALEKFDAVSLWREQDNGAAIDATGTLVSGERFDGPEELAKVIEQRPEFPQCVAEKIATYALGRGMRATDKCVLKTLAERNQNKEGGTRSLILEIVSSALFTKRLPDRGN